LYAHITDSDFVRCSGVLLASQFYSMVNISSWYVFDRCTTPQVHSPDRLRCLIDLCVIHCQHSVMTQCSGIESSATIAPIHIQFGVIDQCNIKGSQGERTFRYRDTFQSITPCNQSIGQFALSLSLSHSALLCVCVCVCVRSSLALFEQKLAQFSLKATSQPASLAAPSRTASPHTMAEH